MTIKILNKLDKMETIRFNFVSRVHTFFTIIAIIFAICLSNGNYSFAQTTKMVGTAGDYATLGAAFNAINSGELTGAITLQIISSITETVSAVLHQSGYTGAGGTSSYTSVNIYPTASGLSISGSLNAPLIDLSGANNVTINGSLDGANAGKDLTITNIGTESSSYYASTIRFISGAASNTVKYCTLKGSCTAAAGGVLYFYNNGNNSNNLIDHNDITNSGVNRLINAIYSEGGLGFTNSGNTISNNVIYDFFNAGYSSQGINISNYSSDWSITGNNFYQTTTLVPTNASTSYSVIRVYNASGNNFTISDNIIGGSAPNNSGTFTLNSTQNITFYGLYINVGTTTASSVQNNTIKSIASTSTSDSPFRGMFIIGGNVNIGTVTGNTIGSTTGTGSISLTNSTANSTSYGIHNQSSGTVNIQKNSIGSITTVGSPTISHSFAGIRSSGGTISDNTIGSTVTANSIYASSSTTGSQTIYGILSGGSTSTIISGNTVSKLTNAAIGTSGGLDGISIGNGTNTITNNTIHDLTNANDYPYSVRGISLNSSTEAAQTVTGNTIYNLLNTNASFTGNVIGIYYQGPTTASTVSGNFIHSLSVTGASSIAASIYGIFIASGATTYSNNIISLGGDTKTSIYGIYETGTASNNNNLYFNTVYIGGTVASGTNKSYALFSVVTTNTRNFRNNIFFNARSTTGGSNKHYAAYFNYGSSSNLTLDYNDYYAPGTGGVLGYYNSANVTSLPLIASNDANSKNTNPSLANAGGTTAANYLPSAITLNGVNGTGITTDYAGTTRIYNSMGAYDYAVNSITVNATSGSSTGYYLTLKTAFDAINAGTHQGAITIQITGSTIETASAYLRASGTGLTIYTSVNIYPTVTGLTISGNLDNPLIDLYGAKNVTINGSLNGANTGKDLIITNTSTSGSTSTSTFRFAGGAASDTVKYCTLKGSSTAASGGVLFFTSDGNNSNNIIDNNNITNSSDNRPVNAIYSYGGSGINSGNTISNNNIYDFFNAGASSQGIYIWNNSSDWSITGNSFYETTTLVPTGTFTYYTIRIDGGSGNNFTVTDNFIGGNASNHTGTFTLNSATNHRFYGIYLLVGTTTASSVQNNTIKSIASTSTSGSPFYGMYIISGNVNIGTETGGNTIGSTTDNGSITLTNSTINATSYGIYSSSSGTVNIQKNSIGSITTVGSATTYHSFYGIYAAGGASGIYTISDNTIGSESTTNSIWASSSTSGRQEIYGIININTNSAIISGNTVSKLTNAAMGELGRMDGIASNTGTNTVTNNTVHDLTSALTTSDEAVRGIFLFSSTAAAQTITGNIIYNLSNTNTSFKGYVTGIYYWETTTASGSTVSKNFIYNLSVSASSTTAEIYGINIRGGAATYSNNMISLGGNTPTTIYGIYEKGAAGNNNNLYFNTVYISGVPTSGTNKSYALFSEANTNTRDFRNNIFFNARSTTSGSNLHYAAYFYSSSNSNLTLNYNDYYAPGTGGVLGYYNSTNVTTLADWKTATEQDVNSTSKLVTFISPTDDLHLNGGSIGDGNLTGTPIDGITTDYFNNTRNVTYPYMGGNDVTDSPLPVLLASLNSVVDGRNVKLNWVTSSEINNAGFEVERAEFRSENLEFRKIGFIAGKGTANTQTSYTFSDTKLNSGKYKYRLKQIDNNGNFEYYNLNVVIEVGLPTKYTLSQNYPNPFNPTTKIDFALPNDSKVSIKVYDMTGREVMNIMNNEQKTAGYYTININASMLSSGVYFYRMISDKFIETKKMAIIK